MKIKDLKTNEPFNVVAKRASVYLEADQRRLGVWSRRVFVLDGQSLYSYRTKGNGGSLNGWSIGNAEVRVRHKYADWNERHHVLNISNPHVYSLTIAFDSLYEQARLVKALSTNGAIVMGVDAIMLMSKLQDFQRSSIRSVQKISEEVDSRPRSCNLVPKLSMRMVHINWKFGTKKAQIHRKSSSESNLNDVQTPTDNGSLTSGCSSQNSLIDLESLEDLSSTEAGDDKIHDVSSREGSLSGGELSPLTDTRMSWSDDSTNNSSMISPISLGSSKEMFEFTDPVEQPSHSNLTAIIPVVECVRIIPELDASSNTLEATELPDKDPEAHFIAAEQPLRRRDAIKRTYKQNCAGKSTEKIPLRRLFAGSTSSNTVDDFVDDSSFATPKETEEMNRQPVQTTNSLSSVAGSKRSSNKVKDIVKNYDNISAENSCLPVAKPMRRLSAPEKSIRDLKVFTKQFSSPQELLLRKSTDDLSQFTAANSVQHRKFGFLDLTRQPNEAIYNATQVVPPNQVNKNIHQYERMTEHPAAKSGPPASLLRRNTSIKHENIDRFERFLTKSRPFSPLRHAAPRAHTKSVCDLRDIFETMSIVSGLRTPLNLPEKQQKHSY